jgi:hypothetical protein
VPVKPGATFTGPEAPMTRTSSLSAIARGEMTSADSSDDARRQDLMGVSSSVVPAGSITDAALPLAADVAGVTTAPDAGTPSALGAGVPHTSRERSP